MLMTVLKSKLATKQSKALFRFFKQMKDYIIENQGLLVQREYLQLSIQTTQNLKEIIDLKQSEYSGQGKPLFQKDGNHLSGTGGTIFLKNFHRVLLEIHKEGVDCSEGIL